MVRIIFVNGLATQLQEVQNPWAASDETRYSYHTT